MSKDWNDSGRKCIKCREYKLWDEYSWKRCKRYKDHPKLHLKKQPACKSCAHQNTIAWRENQSKDRLRDLYYKRTYGLSFGDVCNQLQSQDYKCQICLREVELPEGVPTPTTACVDHDHITGEVRGILCNECNRGLGYFKDNIESLSRAIKYLRR